MLRARLFVDLYSVIRHAVRAGVESYSIKQLEQFYGFKRRIDLWEANRALAGVQACLELAEPEGVDDNQKAIVEAYNRDDCISSHGLRSWLEGIRAMLIERGDDIPRPSAGDDDPSEAESEWQKKIEQLSQRLTADVPADLDDRTEGQHARWVLANVLDWHRRENKAVWWEYFRLSALSSEELLDERSAISKLGFVQSVGGTTRAPVHRYNFPIQETGPLIIDLHLILNSHRHQTRCVIRRGRFQCVTPSIEPKCIALFTVLLVRSSHASIRIGVHRHTRTK